jgi:hypothetical protein
MELFGENSFAIAAVTDTSTRGWWELLCLWGFLYPLQPAQIPFRSALLPTEIAEILESEDV